MIVVANEALPNFCMHLLDVAAGTLRVRLLLLTCAEVRDATVRSMVRRQVSDMVRDRKAAAAMSTEASKLVVVLSCSNLVEEEEEEADLCAVLL